MVSVLHAQTGRATGQCHVPGEEPPPLTVRIVLDTNSLVAALTQPRGSSARILGLWRRRRIELVVTRETLREAELVVGAGWLYRVASRDAVSALLDRLRREAIIVEPARVGDLPLKDRGDRDLVAAAVGGNARFLVTADREVIQQRGYDDVEFVTSAEFLRRRRSSWW
ncbi:MAG TPA: putative toxin-antitoxin system toxin component, PIN family [Dehalococcoidia bacterium]|nr:putative toxin-antitoxin system toxin component, PIN family [Dehalococcoidia bacterium]